jgi:hypothetical protein
MNWRRKHGVELAYIRQRLIGSFDPQAAPPKIERASMRTPPPLDLSRLNLISIRMIEPLQLGLLRPVAPVVFLAALELRRLA